MDSRERLCRNLRGVILVTVRINPIVKPGFVLYTAIWMQVRLSEKKRSSEVQAEENVISKRIIPRTQDHFKTLKNIFLQKQDIRKNFGCAMEIVL